MIEKFCAKDEWIRRRLGYFIFILFIFYILLFFFFSKTPRRRFLQRDFSSKNSIRTLFMRNQMIRKFCIQERCHASSVLLVRLLQKEGDELLRFRHQQESDAASFFRKEGEETQQIFQSNNNNTENAASVLHREGEEEALQRHRNENNENESELFDRCCLLWEEAMLLARSVFLLLSFFLLCL